MATVLTMKDFLLNNSEEDIKNKLFLAKDTVLKEIVDREEDIPEVEKEFDTLISLCSKQESLDDFIWIGVADLIEDIKGDCVHPALAARMDNPVDGEIMACVRGALDSVLDVLRGQM